MYVFCKKVVNLEDFTLASCGTKWQKLHKMMLLNAHAHKRVTRYICGYKFKVPAQWPAVDVYIHVKSEGRVKTD